MTGNLKLRMKLFERKITQTALAKEAKIPRQYISSALTGRVNLSPEEEKKLRTFCAVKFLKFFNAGGMTT